MGDLIHDDNRYIYHENVTKKTLREMKKDIEGRAHDAYMHSNVPTYQRLIKNHSPTFTDSECIKSLDETGLGLNISITNTSGIGDKRCHVYDVKGFTPSVASTPIKRDILVPNNTSNVQHHLLGNSINMENSYLPCNNDVDLNQIQDLILQNTLSNVGTFQGRNWDFVPVATIDNINVNTQNVFEVPNTMIAYLYDETNQILHPMKIVHMDEDISTYEFLQPKAPDITNENSRARASEHEGQREVAKKINRHKIYRKTSLKWKKIRHKLPRRPLKPVEDENAEEIATIIASPLLWQKKRKDNYKSDKNYKPTCKIEVTTGIAPFHLLQNS